MKCPCHSGTNYDKCCGPYHSNLRSPATPLELMRSRYSAYALDLAEYIIETTHPKSPLYEESRSDWLHYIHEFHKTTTFEGLIIESYDETHVTFFAILKTDSKDTSFREKSLFKKFKGLWRYVRKETPET